MAKNPNSVTTNTATQTANANKNSQSQDLESTMMATGGSDGATAATQPSATDGNAMKLDVKSAAAAAAPTTATSESQVVAGSSKMRKLQTPLPPEDVNLACLLLADASLECAPLHLRQLLQHFDNSALTSAEMLLLLIYCVALESGYATQSEATKCAETIRRLTASSAFHSKNVQCLARQQPNYTLDESKTHLVMRLRSLLNLGKTELKTTELLNSLLTCLVTGDFLIVTLTPERTAGFPGRSVCLSIGRYVLSAHPKGKPLYQRFRKLSELSELLREKMFVPVRNCQLEALEMRVFPSLLGMPVELCEAVFQYLSQNQLNIMANVCRRLNYLSNNSKYIKPAL